MKIVLAFDSFKGSLDAWQVTRAVQNGIQRVDKSAEIEACPVADGGEGTVDILTKVLDGQIITARVRGPLMEFVDARWGWVKSQKMAIIEAAAAVGLTLVPEIKRDPCITTSYGVGELIIKALDSGAVKIIIGLGGSATTDGGTGMAEALGVRFAGCTSPMNGNQLVAIKAVNTSGLDRRVATAEFLTALDVNNPLLGTKGTARVFAPQKGASAQQVEFLENGLQHLTNFFPDVNPAFPGAGAAGGLGWGLAAWVNSKAKSGIDLCLDYMDFDNKLKNADCVITGEGSFDQQTLQGKAVMGVTRRAKAQNVPVIVLAGDHNVTPNIYKKYGVSACYSLCKHFNITKEKAIDKAVYLLENLATKISKQLIVK